MERAEESSAPTSCHTAAVERRASENDSQPHTSTSERFITCFNCKEIPRDGRFTCRVCLDTGELPEAFSVECALLRLPITFAGLVDLARLRMRYGLTAFSVTPGKEAWWR